GGRHEAGVARRDIHRRGARTRLRRQGLPRAERHAEGHPRGRSKPRHADRRLPLRQPARQGDGVVQLLIRGALAAALTPLADGGARVDEDAIGPYVDFLAGSGLDGLLALGTTGEGILLSHAERTRVAEHFLEA